MKEVRDIYDVWKGSRRQGGVLRQVEGDLAMEDFFGSFLGGAKKERLSGRTRRRQTVFKEVRSFI